MMIETDLVAFAQIVFHSESGERNAENRMIIFELCQQIDSASVRQADVADEDIESFLGRGFQCGLNTVRRLDVIPAPSQKLGERTIGILVVLDKQNTHRLMRDWDCR